MPKIKVAGTVCKITQEEGVLAVYTSREWCGAYITVYDPGAFMSVVSREKVTEHRTWKNTVYAAIFPKLLALNRSLFVLVMPQKNYFVEGVRYEEIDGQQVHKDEHSESSVFIYPGKLTELDWTGLR